MTKEERGNLDEAGFFSDEFMQGMIELRKHMSLAQIKKVIGLAGELKDNGIDPLAVLQRAS